MVVRSSLSVLRCWLRRGGGWSGKMISMCEDRWSYCGASLSRAEVMAIRYRLSYIGGGMGSVGGWWVGRK